MAKKKEAKKEGKKSTSNIFKNYWAIATIVLAIILVLVSESGSGISADTAGEKTVAFLNQQTGGGVELVEVIAQANIYEVTVSYQGQEIPLYITRDGENLVQGLTPLDATDTPAPQQNPEPTNIPKSDKPDVELYVWSYCPYGVQAQGPLAEVASLLGNSINTKTFMYYDGHGAYETQQNKIQACIQTVAPEKYWNYAAKFVSDIYPVCGQSKDIDCDLTESTTLMDSLGIDSAAVLSCVDTQGAQLIAADSASAQSKGVTGSPTVIINGVKAQVARTPEAIKTAICSAFNTAPAECGEQLEAAAAAQAAGSC